MLNTNARLMLIFAALSWSSACLTDDYVAPRTPAGHPDLQGIWQVLSTAAWDLEDHNAASGVPAGQSVVVGGQIPYQAWALEEREEHRLAGRGADPESKCYLPGVPRITYMPFPLQILQTENSVTIAYEFAHALRHIPIDGSNHIEGVEFWMGDSRGRWENETLVVSVTSFNDRTWFDKAGNFHSTDLRVVERYTRISDDVIDYEATVDDPKVFERPWKIQMPLYRRQEQNVQLLEYECVEFVLEEWYGKKAAAK